MKFTKIKRVDERTLEERRHYFYLINSGEYTCYFCFKKVNYSTKTLYEFFNEYNYYKYGLFCGESCLNLWLLQNNV
jgi:hypothetical protein